MAKEKQEKDLWRISKTANMIFHAICGLFAVSCIIPFVLVVMISVTDEAAIKRNGYSFFPEQFSLAAYKYAMFATTELWRATGISIFVCVMSVLLSMIVAIACAYALSRPEFRYGRAFSLFLYGQSLFGGNMVITYLIMTKVLFLKDSVWAMIIPNIASVYWFIVLRTFIKSTIGDSLIEAARIDGASEMRILFRLVIPLMKPALASMAVICTIYVWSDWFLAWMYISDPAKYPLQYLLMKVQMNIEFMLTRASQLTGVVTKQMADSLPKESIQMALMVIINLPLVFAYPYFQRYFVSGLTLGGEKG